MKSYIKSLEPFRGELHFIVCDKLSEAASKYNCDADDAKDDAFSMKAIGEDGEVDFIIAVKPGSPIDDIVHECMHFVGLMCDHHGIKHDSENDELFAYYMGYYSGWCIGNLYPKLQKHIGFKIA